VIIVDTSVWIDYFNGKITPYTDHLDKELLNGNVALGDLILLEILQGIKNDKQYTKTKDTLQKLDQYEMLGQEMVIRCADYYRSLRKKGLTIRKTADVIIATFCIENRLPLLFTDRDFAPFVEHCGLQEVRP
jgi:predicted nucleic acid-binding protein|tara:strand:+ start:355 stop:750 length:396 start_codon:yes stop_codon:yes gene_type:complete